MLAIPFWVYTLFPVKSTLNYSRPIKSETSLGLPRAMRATPSLNTALI